METPLADLGEFLWKTFQVRQTLSTNSSDSRHTLIPPRGYSIAGIYGSCGPWIDGFGLIITR